MRRSVPPHTTRSRHPRWVKITHWIVTLSFLFLVFTGYEILMVHPRLYWGEAGNDLTPAAFELPISRNYKHGGWTNKMAFLNTASSPVSMSRTYDIFNQNGWGRSLHFLSAWFLVAAGLVYLLVGLLRSHFRSQLMPEKTERSAGIYWRDFTSHLRFRVQKATEKTGYGPLQKLSYLLVIFILLPSTVLTGMAMSPAIVAAYPFLTKMFFGAQSARTIHFFAAVLLVLFLLVHIVMIILSGFRQQMKAMTFGK